MPLNFNYMFSGIFNDKNNLIIVENFVALYLKEPIEKIKGKVEINSRDMSINNKQNKNKQVDLLVDLDGEKINIELTNRMSEGVKDRNIVYASEVHGKQLKYSDNNYSKINRTLQINLNNFKCNKDKLVDTYYLRNDDGKILSKKFQIDYVDLVKAKKKIYNEDEERLAKFCRALNCETLEGLKQEIGGTMEKEAEKKLIEEVDKYSRDDETIALYSAYSREELERNTLVHEAKENGYNDGFNKGFDDGFNDGFNNGFNDGLNQTKLDIAKNMIKENIDISTIIKVTGLTKQEILDLK